MAQSHADVVVHTPTRAAIASALEYSDFFIYGTATAPSTSNLVATA